MSTRKVRGGPPKDRDCQIYERHILEEETQECLAAEFRVTQQRVGQIAAAVEAWIARHPEHPLAQRMRLRCNRHWQAIWSRSIESFDRSREETARRRKNALPVGRQPKASGPSRPSPNGRSGSKTAIRGF